MTRILELDYICHKISDFHHFLLRQVERLAWKDRLCSPTRKPAASSAVSEARKISGNAAEVLHQTLGSCGAESFRESECPAIAAYLGGPVEPEAQAQQPCDLVRSTNGGSDRRTAVLRQALAGL
jgi:hypothetical protein